ncbi:Lactonase, 7-bladed beta-propeller-domain-containing protein [Panaeolus papilionaceus]|nr:Lactonase, 7-bladed beta-propeller-domain-containing protein [Panaeolus papilionaceus]
MVQFKILAGGYDFFIATYLFNSLTSSLTLVSKSQSGQNPSWISLNPTNRSLLYAVNENWYGSLQSFGINQAGSLTSAIDTVYSGGDVPAFTVALSTGAVAIMNYQSGTGRIVPTISGSSNSKFDPNSPIITFSPPSGGASHPHMALESNGEVLVPDLGADTIWRLKQVSGSSSYQIQGSISQPKGSGPRHIAIYNDRLFTLHELSSTLSVQTLPSQPNGSSTTFATVSIIPSNPPSGAKWAAAEILIPPTTSRFPTPYIYVSNRNTANNSPQGDSIAIFEHVNKGQSNEGLKLVNQVYTGLNQVRGMAFGNADQGGEEFLVASGVAGSGGVIVLRRTDSGRNLEIVARNTDVLTRSSFVWL